MVEFDDVFKRTFNKIKDSSFRAKIKKQIRKIIENPLIGKPMKYARKGTREVYIKPYRVSYAFVDDDIYFLEIYHKDEQ